MHNVIVDVASLSYAEKFFQLMRLHCDVTAMYLIGSCASTTVSTSTAPVTENATQKRTRAPGPVTRADKATAATRTTVRSRLTV